MTADESARLESLQNDWRWAAICQFISIFGKAMSIDNLDSVKLERQLVGMGASADYIQEVRFALIKSLSSNRTITLENMDNFIRRQYTYRGVSPNPLEPVCLSWRTSSPALSDNSSSLSDVEQVSEKRALSWAEITLSEKIRILHDLCEWHLLSERFRDSLGATETEMTSWRVEPIGRDSNDVLYYHLDDGRLYCRTDPSTSFVKQKKRKENNADSDNPNPCLEDWTCLASDHSQWISFSDTLEAPLDTNEKRLYRTLKEELLPDIVAAEAARKDAMEKAEQARIKQLLIDEALSSRKRSSRIQSQESRRHEREKQAEAQRQHEELQLQAKRLLEREQNDKAAPHPITREARARDRQLRIFMLSRAADPDVPAVDEDLATASPERPTEIRTASQRDTSPEAAQQLDNVGADASLIQQV